MSTPVPTVARTFAPAAESVRAARRFVADTLRADGRQRVIDAAVLVASELVTNAVLHARTAIVVRLSTSAGRVRLEVEDGSATRPATRAFSDLAGSGRGLRLVDAVAADWGVDALPRGGKVVWLELSLEGSDESSDEDVEEIAFDLDSVEPL